MVEGRADHSEEFELNSKHNGKHWSTLNRRGRALIHIFSTVLHYRDDKHTGAGVDAGRPMSRQLQ